METFCEIDRIVDGIYWVDIKVDAEEDRLRDILFMSEQILC